MLRPQHGLWWPVPWSTMMKLKR